MTRALGYYVRIDSYWQNAPDRWVGPFATEADAHTEISRATSAADSLVCLASQMASDVRHGIRVYGIASQSQAQRKGLRDYSLGDDHSNLIGTQIPLSTDDLFEIEQAQAE